MGWGNFLKSAVKTGLRVAVTTTPAGGLAKQTIGALLPQVDPSILATLGSRDALAGHLVKKIGGDFPSQASAAWKIGEFIYDAKTLVELYKLAMADGKLSIAEAQALMDGLQALVDDVDDLI